MVVANKENWNQKMQKGLAPIRFNESFLAKNLMRNVNKPDRP